MAVPIATRTSWNPAYSDGDINLSGLAVQVFAHHSVSVQLPPTATVAQEAAQMQALEATGHSRFATPEAPNFGISYNVLVFPSGRAYQGVSWNRRGAHTDGRNSTTRSICFAGNYDEHEPTEAQLITASAIYHEGKGKWWTTGAPLYGHRDIKATDCPGQHVYSRLDDIAAGRYTQEDDMTPEQDQRLEDVERNVAEIETVVRRIDGVLSRKLADGKGANTPDQIWQRTLVVARRVEARQIANETVPVTVDVDAADLADAFGELLKTLPAATAQAVLDGAAARLAN